MSLPFTERKAKYHEHLRAAVDVVERACRLCVDVISFFYYYLFIPFLVPEFVMVHDSCYWNSLYFGRQVQKSLLSSDGNIIEKIDQTPVTVADFGVQALISLGIVFDNQ